MDSGLFMIYFMAFVCMAVIIWAQHTMKHNRALKAEKESLGSRLNKSFSFEKESATENQEKKYSVDMASIEKYMNMGRQLAMGSIARGNQMQREEGSKKDWAIAGGIASGLAGGAVGAAVAIQTIQENADSTRKHHEAGRRMVEQGQESLRRIDSDMLNIRNAVSHRKDSFKYTEFIPKLINYFDVTDNAVCVSCNEKITHTHFKLNGTQEKVNLNAVELYNEIGYFTAHIIIKNNKLENDADNKRYRIDGGFRVDLYDGEEKIAMGYVTDGSWSVESHKDIGFKESIDKIITFKLCKDKQLVPDKKYEMKLEEPNLWLVEM